MLRDPDTSTNDATLIMEASDVLSLNIHGATEEKEGVVNEPNSLEIVSAKACWTV